MAGKIVSTNKLNKTIRLTLETPKWVHQSHGKITVLLGGEKTSISNCLLSEPTLV